MSYRGMTRALLIAPLLACLIAPRLGAQQDNTELLNRIRAMEQRIQALEAEVTALKTAPTGGPSQVVAQSAPAPAASTAAGSAARPAPVEDGLHVVTAPIVGTFYRSPNPDAEPFVKTGGTVEKGQTLCIIEAMKLMNEIEADADGTVVEVFPQNGQPVEYGERLFSIRPR